MNFCGSHFEFGMLVRIIRMLVLRLEQDEIKSQVQHEKYCEMYETLL